MMNVHSINNIINIHKDCTTIYVMFTRTGNKWNINECLALQREYELLKLPLCQIAKKHKRTISAIYNKLISENYNLDEDNNSDTDEDNNSDTYEDTDKDYIDDNTIFVGQIVMTMYVLILIYFL